MSNYNSQRYYWIKLKRNFFKRHDIAVVEALPNGKDYVLFYLKLMLESIDHEGALRFSETIPYNENMLAAVTNTNIDVVRAAIDIFRQLGMLEILDDKTIYMTEIEHLIGSQTEGAEKKQLQRIGGQTADKCLPSGGQTADKCPTEIEIDKEKDNIPPLTFINKSISPQGEEKHRFLIPSVIEIKAYCEERGNGVDANKFYDFYSSKGWMIGKNKMKDWKAAVRTWENKNGRRDGEGEGGIPYAN